MPVAWVTGEPIRFGDSGVIHVRMCSSSASKVRCVCITPFGSLVVPDVYASTHTSSGSAARDPLGGRGVLDDVPSGPGQVTAPGPLGGPDHEVEPEVGERSRR